MTSPEDYIFISKCLFAMVGFVLLAGAILFGLSTLVEIEKRDGVGMVCSGCTTAFFSALAIIVFYGTWTM